jgi:hypothetical protein
MVTFKPSSEQSYYSKNRFIKSLEKTYDSGNRFRLSYYISGNNVFVYYMGRYYIGTMLKSEIEEIDLINLILTQCNDPYKVAEEEELIELD